MVKSLNHFKVAAILFACLVSPLFGQAAVVDPDPVPPPASDTTPPPGEVTNPPSITNEYSLNNPIKVDSIQELLNLILRLVIIIATPIVVLFIVFAGFKYVTARGNASQIEEATKALTYSVIGGVLIIGAVAIAEIIKDLVNSF